MIGIIITGHGNSASGMLSAVRILEGTPEKCLAVNYSLEDTSDDLELALKKAVRELEDCSGILFMADISGGVPYKTACGLTLKYGKEKKMAVTAGFNLGMVMQTNMARAYVNDVNALAELARDEGRRQVLMRTYEELADED